MSSNRNVAIDAMRFVFICLLCPVHCPAVNPFPNGYIAVEFFFVLAGFFVYRSFRAHPELRTIDFTLKKMRRFFWPLVLSIGVMMLLDRKRFIYPHELTPDGIVSQYFMRIPELMFCQGLEIAKPEFYVNVSLWFISILLFGGAIIFSLLKNVGHKAIALILPLLILLGITYLTSFGDCGLVWRPQLSGSPIDCNLLRGVVEMSLGVVVAYVLEQKESSFGNHVFGINIMGGIGLLGMLLIALSHEIYDTLALFLSPMIIIACVCRQSFFAKMFRGKVWAWLGNLSMYIYFIHIFVSASYYIIISRVSLLRDLPFAVSFLVYVVACAFTGFVFKEVADMLYRKTFKR